jgi:hypothetical protein
MLIIREAQMSAFRHAAVDRFRHRMLAYLRRRHPQASERLGDDGLQRLLDCGLAKAKCHGIESTGNVSIVIEWLLRFGKGFEGSGDPAWMNAMLARHELPASVRIESIIRHLNAKTGGRVVVRDTPPLSTEADRQPGVSR